MPRIAIGQVSQETNTFATSPTTLTAFTGQALFVGDDALRTAVGTESELAGAGEALAEAGDRVIPLLRAHAMPGGRLTDSTFTHLLELLLTELRSALPVDGVYLSLHGALSTSGIDDADGEIISAVRRLIGPGVPLVVSLDLHANLTARMASAADVLIGYHEYPHIDIAETGRRAVSLLHDLLAGHRLATVIAKRPMIVPPEGANTRGGPLRRLRELADAATGDGIRDVSLFPVQPWLDVEELGFAAAVTATEEGRARDAAEHFADLAWEDRQAMTVELVPPDAAIARVRDGFRPAILVESADSPTAGSSADSPAMIRALLSHGAGLRAFTTVVDGPAVGACWTAGVGPQVELTLGATIDSRFHQPCPVQGFVRLLSDRPVTLQNVLRGTVYDMGRHAVVELAEQLFVLVTERPAVTFDPETFRAVGLAPETADIVVVRSAFNYRDAFRGIIDRCIVLDLPGASTPRLGRLQYTRVPRPLFPLDAEVQ